VVESATVSLGKTVCCAVPLVVGLLSFVVVGLLSDAVGGLLSAEFLLSAVEDSTGELMWDACARSTDTSNLPQSSSLDPVAQNGYW